MRAYAILAYASAGDAIAVTSTCKSSFKWLYLGSPEDLNSSSCNNN